MPSLPQNSSWQKKLAASDKAAASYYGTPSGNGPRGRAKWARSLIVDALPIQSDSDCPSPEAVQAQVRELTTPEQRAAVPVDAKVLVSDHDDSIAVAITRDGKTSVRVYQDAARDCERRN